ncbi:sigma-70 family RNA polymerase sigma factor [Haloimpatiens sp. FM7315]|uniref:sigma-70 family RNA polymerase sigma factor n=1 Tax=Haloimpatiens sp. FM7315 TaxID=3298609 RepID=UPI0035A2CC38
MNLKKDSKNQSIKGKERILDSGLESLNEVVIRAKNKDEKAIEEIIKRFKPFIYKMINSIYIKGQEKEDLWQMANISIINVLKKFDTERSSNFTSYVTTAIRNDFYYEIRRKAKENYDISLQTPVEEGINIEDTLKDTFDLESEYLKKERLQELNAIIAKLSKEEREILSVMLNYKGGAMREYAKKKGVSYSAIYKRKMKVLEKIKKFLKIP